MPFKPSIEQLVRWHSLTYILRRDILLEEVIHFFFVGEREVNLIIFLHGRARLFFYTTHEAADDISTLRRLTRRRRNKQPPICVTHRRHRGLQYNHGPGFFICFHVPAEVEWLSDEAAANRLSIKEKAKVGCKHIVKKSAANELFHFT